MIPVWYDADCDQIWIGGQGQTFARRSLVASMEPGEAIGIRLKASAPTDLLLKTAFGNVTDAAGNAFSSAAATKLYLDGEFAKRRAAACEFAQAAPASFWRITHGLGFRPNVSVIDSAGDVCLADVAWPDAATVIVTFGAPTSGTAYLS